MSSRQREPRNIDGSYNIWVNETVQQAFYDGLRGNLVVQQGPILVDYSGQRMGEFDPKMMRFNDRSSFIDDRILSYYNLLLITPEEMAYAIYLDVVKRNKVQSNEIDESQPNDPVFGSVNIYSDLVRGNVPRATFLCSSKGDGRRFKISRELSADELSSIGKALEDLFSPHYESHGDL